MKLTTRERIEITPEEVMAWVRGFSGSGARVVYATHTTDGGIVLEVEVPNTKTPVSA